MASVVEATVPHLRVVKQLLPVVVVRTGRRAPTGLRREEPALIRPGVPRRRALDPLLGPVGPQQVDELCGQSDRPPSRAGLGIGGLRVGPLTLRAVTRLPPAGVTAAVGVARPTTTPPNHEHPAFKVHVRPLESEHLALAKSEGEHHGSACGVPTGPAVPETQTDRS